MNRILRHILLMMLLLGGSLACRKESVFDPDFECFALLPAEGLGDRGFVDAVYEGIEEAVNRYSFRVNYIFPASLEAGARWIDSIPSLRSRIGSTALIIIGGNQFTADIDRLNGHFGGNKVLFVGGQAVPHPGLVSVDYSMFAPAWLATYLSASRITRCRALFVAGFDAPFVADARAGFEQGLADAGGILNPPVYLSDNFAGFTMADSAHTLAQSLWPSNDLIFGFADGSNFGIINAAREYGESRYVIGVDADQNWMGRKVVTGSIVKLFGDDILEFTGQFARGEFGEGHFQRSLASGRITFLINPNVIGTAGVPDSLVRLALDKENEYLGGIGTDE